VLRLAPNLEGGVGHKVNLVAKAERMAELVSRIKTVWCASISGRRVYDGPAVVVKEIGWSG